LPGRADPPIVGGINRLCRLFVVAHELAPCVVSNRSHLLMI
jgi:hypothetical protein